MSKKVVKASANAKARKAIQASSGSIEDMLDAFEGRLSQLENFEDGVTMSTDIYEDENEIEECGDIYSSDEIESSRYFEDGGITYYETDARRLLGEEDMYAEIIGGILGVMEQSGLSLEESAQASREWFEELISRAVKDIESEKAVSIYDR